VNEVLTRDEIEEFVREILNAHDSTTQEGREAQVAALVERWYDDYTNAYTEGVNDARSG
jgi:hypothetical protein